MLRTPRSGAMPSRPLQRGGGRLFAGCKDGPPVQIFFFVQGSVLGFTFFGCAFFWVVFVGAGIDIEFLFSFQREALLQLLWACLFAPDRSFAPR